MLQELILGDHANPRPRNKPPLDTKLKLTTNMTLLLTSNGHPRESGGTRKAPRGPQWDVGLGAPRRRERNTGMM